jgi:hypothetical protein
VTSHGCVKDNMIVMTELIPTSLASKSTSKCRYLMGETNSNIQHSTSDMTSKRQNVGPRKNKHSTRFSVPMLYFAFITFFVRKTNLYYKYLQFFDDRPTVPAVTESEISGN